MSNIETASVLVNRSLLEWQSRALERMVSDTGVDISLVVVNEITDINHPGFTEGASPLGVRAYDNARGLSFSDFVLFVRLLRQERAWTFVLAEEKLSWMLGMNSPGLRQRIPLDDVGVLNGVERVHCNPIPIEGRWCDLPEDIVSRISSETDITIRFGFNLLKGEVISRPTNGVLSFHPGDIRLHRGIGPAQPFLHGEKKAGATLQQLTNKLDGGNVVLIESIDITDLHTLDQVRHRVNEAMIEMLPRGIERLRDPDFSPSPPTELAPYCSVENRRSPRFAGKILAKNLIGRFHSVMDKNIEG